MKNLFAALLGLTTVAAACGGEDAVTPPTTPSSAPMVAIGDSIMAWNSEAQASIPDVVGQRLSVEVENRSVGGAVFLDAAEGIPTQYVQSAWSWLILDGGGNDVNDGCECGDCRATLDALLSADGQSGAIASFIDQVRATGVKVAFVGYYVLPSGAAFGFDRCGDELSTMRTRASLMATSRDGVIFVDATQAVQATDLSMYDDDRVHPSVAGSAAVGALIADQIRAAGL